MRGVAIATNAKLGEAKTAADVLGVLAQVDVNSPTFDGVCVATSFHKLAKYCAGCVTEDGRPSDHCKMAVVRSAEFQGLMRAAMVKYMKIRNLSNVLWSCAKMMPAIETCKELRPVVGRLVSSVSSQLAMAFEGKDTVVPQNLSNIMWSLPELRVERQEDVALADAIGQIERHMPTLIARFEPQHIANTLLAFSKLSHRPSRNALDALEAHISNMEAGMWTPQALSNTMYALGSLNAGQPLTIHELLVASMRKAHEFSPNNAAILLKGLALRADRSSDRMAVAISSVPGCLEAFTSILADSSPTDPTPATHQNLSDTLWSLARLGVRDASVFETICSKFLGLGREPPPAAVINVIWAYGKAGISLPDAFKNWSIRYMSKQMNN